MSLTSLIILLILGTFFIGSLWHPIMGVLGYLTVYITFNHTSWYFAPLLKFISRPSFTITLLLITGCLIHYNKLDWRFTKKEIAIYLFLGTAWVVTYFWGILIDHDTLKFLHKLTNVFVFIFLLIRVVNTWERFNSVLWVMIAGTVFIGYQAQVAGDISTGRVENIGGVDFSEANVFSAFMVLGMILLGFKLLRTKWQQKIFYIIGITIMADAFILAQSRAVFLGLFVAVPFLIYRIPQNYKKQILLYVTLAVIMFSFLINSAFLERMRTIEDQALLVNETSPLLQNSIPIGRLDYWKASIEIFKDYPLGIGVSNFANIVPMYDSRNPGLDPHNTYVKCYTELGIIGIFLFIYIIFKSFLELRQIRKSMPRTDLGEEFILSSIALETIIITYLFGVMVTHSILYSEIVWILFGLVICLKKISDKNVFGIN